MVNNAALWNLGPSKCTPEKGYNTRRDLLMNQNKSDTLKGAIRQGRGTRSAFQSFQLMYRTYSVQVSDEDEDGVDDEDEDGI